MNSLARTKKLARSPERNRMPTSIVFDGDDLEDVKKAAALAGVSVSEFLRTVGVKKARAIITRSGRRRRCPHCGAAVKHSAVAA